MAKKKYTVLILSQQASRVKRFILSPLTLKIGATALALLLIVSAYLFYEYITYKKKIFDLKELRSELNSRQAEIQSFLEKITLLEEQLTRLKLFEEQVKKDLKEVQELKKGKKVKKLAPPPILPHKTSQKTEDLQSKKRALFFRQDEVSILEKERPKLVSGLYMELMDLSKEAFQREQTLQELKGFLLAQKSVLLSIPSIWPVFGRITSVFGETRLSASSGGTRPHRGLDISAPIGTAVVAPAEGTVTSAGRESEYGLMVCLNHGHGYTTVYGHLQKVRVKVGDRVQAGQIMGTVGISGNTTGPHLHYEVRINGRPVNPRPYLTKTL